MIVEPARNLPVFRTCDVLVVGGGPAGTAAACAAARLGADTLLLERYGYLGGMSTGGFVLWIDRMSDWQGRKVIAGFADELLGRLPEDAILGAPSPAWGSTDASLVAYWKPRHGASRDTVTWSPIIDPEWLKLVSADLVRESGAELLLHCWAVRAIVEGDDGLTVPSQAPVGPDSESPPAGAARLTGAVRGVVFESKQGSMAVVASAVIDATGDGDVFASAGAAYETDIAEGTWHHTINLAFRWGGVDFARYLAFQRDDPQAFEDARTELASLGIGDPPYPAPTGDVVFFMGPKLTGYSCLDVRDLTAVEHESRRLMLRMLEYYRKQVPGFERAWILDTAPQMGVRHSRRLAGAKKVLRSEWLRGKVHEDEIGLCPPPSPEHESMSIPFGCLVPRELEGLLVAGRNLSSDPQSHLHLREIPVCWVMGQAAGTAAALALESGSRLRDVDVKRVQRALRDQGAELRVSQEG